MKKLGLLSAENSVAPSAKLNVSISSGDVSHRTKGTAILCPGIKGRKDSHAISRTWLGCKDEETAIVKVTHLDVQTSYGPVYDPLTRMAMAAADEITVEQMPSRLFQNALSAQKGYLWQVCKTGDVIRKNFSHWWWKEVKA